MIIETPRKALKSRKVKRSSQYPSEDYEQAKFAAWMTNRGIKFYAIPNGGRRSLMEGIKFKRTGVQPGVPDICIPIPSGQFHGLYIEMKKVKGGKLNDNQIYWLNFLREKGYYAEVAHGSEEARYIVEHYLSLTNPAA